MEGQTPVLTHYFQDSRYDLRYMNQSGSGQAGTPVVRPSKKRTAALYDCADGRIGAAVKIRDFARKRLPQKNRGGLDFRPSL